MTLISFQGEKRLHLKWRKIQENCNYSASKDKWEKKKLTQSMRLTLLTAEVRQSHVLQGDLLQKRRTLTARVTRHNLSSPQPVTEPGQSTVTVEGVGQEVAVGDR